MSKSSVTKMAFHQWKKRCLGELMSRTGLEQGDISSEEQMKQFYKDQATPQEIVDWWIDKYDLTDYQSAPWERRSYELLCLKAKQQFGYDPLGDKNG